MLRAHREFRINFETNVEILWQPFIHSVYCISSSNVINQWQRINANKQTNANKQQMLCASCFFFIHSSLDGNQLNSSLIAFKWNCIQTPGPQQDLSHHVDAKNCQKTAFICSMWSTRVAWVGCVKRNSSIAISSSCCVYIFFRPCTFVMPSWYRNKPRETF